jgi:hypothetical protein
MHLNGVVAPLHFVLNLFHLFVIKFSSTYLLCCEFVWLYNLGKEWILQNMILFKLILCKSAPT